MTWAVAIGTDAPIVEITGDVTASELAEGVGAVLDLGRAQRVTRVLTDGLGVTGGPSAADLYYISESVRSSGVGWAMCEALLLPNLPAVAETAAFWETSCHNRGLDSRVFTDRNRAFAWLLE